MRDEQSCTVSKQFLCLAHAGIGVRVVTASPVEHVYDGLDALLRVVRRARQRWAEDHPGVPTGVIGLLAQIERTGGEGAQATGCRLKDLAAGAGLDASTVSRETAHLIAMGLVERRTDPTDGRAARLALTELGRQQLQALRAGVLEQLDRAVESWDAAEVEAFAAALHRFTDGLCEVTTAPPHPRRSHSTGPLGPGSPTSSEVSR